ncbi:MAG: hypothetical protein NTW21_17835 [Verrucomicrobia bacterium]|nr:hypothetical protein [Verrucomicrobiota bacterium]
MNHPLAPILGRALLLLPAAARAARMPPPNEPRKNICRIVAARL